MMLTFDLGRDASSISLNKLKISVSSDASSEGVNIMNLSPDGIKKKYSDFISVENIYKTGLNDNGEDFTDFMMHKFGVFFRKPEQGSSEEYTKLFNEIYDGTSNIQISLDSAITPEDAQKVGVANPWLQKTGIALGYNNKDEAGGGGLTLNNKNNVNTDIDATAMWLRPYQANTQENIDGLSIADAGYGINITSTDPKQNPLMQYVEKNYDDGELVKVPSDQPYPLSDRNIVPLGLPLKTKPKRRT